jgi:DUF971 family protein
MPIPIDERRKPAKVKVHVSTNAGVDITWADGHSSHYDFSYLRDQCPCALCNEERAKKSQAKFPAAPAGLAGSSVLPMYKPKLAAKSAHTVGNYALQIDFNDGHTAGIFSFDYLRTICPCADCAREFRTASDTD